MYKLILLFTVLCSGLYAQGQTSGIGDDAQRIIYWQYARSNAPGRFLVIDRRTRQGEFECHYLGSGRKAVVPERQVQKLKFYENTPPFMISQYALYGAANLQKKNLPLALSRVKRDPHGRMLKFNEFENATRQFLRQLRQITRNRNSDVEQEDKIDAVYELLEKCPLPDMIKAAAASRDWVLTIAMYKNLSAAMLLPLAKAFPGTAILDDVRKILADCEQELCETLLRQLQQPNIRREQFKKYYPYASGLWNELPPVDFQGVKVMFERSMQSYFALDKLSALTDPQEWGSAVLDVLLLLEGTPGAAELEKDFDNEMRRLEKRRNRAENDGKTL